MAYRWASTDQNSGVHTFLDDNDDPFEFLDAEVEHLHLDLTGLDADLLAKVAPEISDLTIALASAEATTRK